MFWLGFVVGIFTGAPIVAFLTGLLLNAVRRQDELELIRELSEGDGPGDFQGPRAGGVGLADEAGEFVRGDRPDRGQGLSSKL